MVARVVAVVAAVAGVGRLRGAGRVVGGAGPVHHTRPGPGGVPRLGVARPPRTVEGGAGGAGGARRPGGRGVGVVLGVEVEESAAEAGVAGAGVVGGGWAATEVRGGMQDTGHHSVHEGKETQLKVNTQFLLALCMACGDSVSG